MALLQKKGAPLSSLNDLLVLELQDLYSTEQQIIKAMPKRICKARNFRTFSSFLHFDVVV